MISVSKIGQELCRLLTSRISLKDFEDWFVSYRQDIHKHSPADAQELAFAIDNVLSQFEGDSEELRNSLRDIHNSLRDIHATPTVSAERIFNVKQRAPMFLVVERRHLDPPPVEIAPSVAGARRWFYPTTVQTNKSLPLAELTST